MNEKLPICPLMSAGADVPQICTSVNCAWYIKTAKICSINALAQMELAKLKTEFSVPSR